jgi:serine/threonine protein kinase
LKPENVMLRSKDNVSDIVIIDLGLSRDFEPGQKLTSRVGSCYYSPPEIQAKLYDESCDFWSLGIMIFVMLCSYPPFDGDDDRAVYDAVQKGTFSYKRRDWDKRSVGGPALIDQLLSLEPSKRPKAPEVLADKWIKAGTRHQEKLMRKKADAEANCLPFVINRFGQYDPYATDAKLKSQKSKTPSQTSKELDAMNLQILNASTGQQPGDLPKGTSLDGESNSNKDTSNAKNKESAPSPKKKKGWF